MKGSKNKESFRLKCYNCYDPLNLSFQNKPSFEWSAWSFIKIYNSVFKKILCPLSHVQAFHVSLYLFKRKLTQIFTDMITLHVFHLYTGRPEKKGDMEKWHFWSYLSAFQWFPTNEFYSLYKFSSLWLFWV